LLSEIIDELERLDGPEYPDGLLGEVLEAGNYRQAVRMIDAATTREAREQLPQTPIFALAHEIRGEWMFAEMQRRKREAGLG